MATKKWWEVPYSGNKKTELDKIANEIVSLGKLEQEDDEKLIREQKELIQKMGFYSSSAVNPFYIDDLQEKLESEPKEAIIFFGFNGLLGGKYSRIRLNPEEIEGRMSFLSLKQKEKVPWSYHSLDGFRSVLGQLTDGPTSLQEIPFDDALNIIRIGTQEVKIDDYEDAEEDEFTDDCLETCLPGLHKCGKK